MAEIVNSLFGLSPQKIKQQQFENDLAMARLYAQDPRAGDRMLGFQAGAGLARGVLGGLGFEDPELKRARELEEVLLETQQQVGEADFSNPAVLYPTLAENLKKRGYGREATQVMLQGGPEIVEYKKTQAQATKAQKEADILAKKAENEELLRTELSSLPTDASDEDYLNVVRKYGDPDKIMSSIEKKQAAREAREARADEVRMRLEQQEGQFQERLQDQRLAREDRAMLQTQLAQMRLDAQRDIARLRGDAKKDKELDKIEKMDEKRKNTLLTIDNVMSSLDNAEALVGRGTAGLGSVLNIIPGTKAKDLDTELTSIKANLGFDRLQQMRDASPTGGALGQVAVQELVALQSTVASLDPAQSPDKLKSQIKKIKGHYQKWRETLLKADDNAPVERPSVTVNGTKYLRPENFTDQQWEAYKKSVGGK